MVLYLVAWSAYLAGFVVLGRKKGEFSPMFILVTGLVARIVLLPSGVIQEDDFYRYVLDGEVVLHGENPYEFFPSVISDLTAPGLRESLLTSFAEGVRQRIGYPDVSTVYPPAAQWAFAVGALLTGWDWMGAAPCLLDL